MDEGRREEAKLMGGVDAGRPLEGVGDTGGLRGGVLAGVMARRWLLMLGLLSSESMCVRSTLFIQQWYL